jgi:hypothetical protein
MWGRVSTRNSRHGPAEAGPAVPTAGAYGTSDRMEIGSAWERISKFNETGARQETRLPELENTNDGRRYGRASR